MKISLLTKLFYMRIVFLFYESTPVNLLIQKLIALFSFDPENLVGTTFGLQVLLL